MVYLCALGRYAAYDDVALFALEGVVMDTYPVAGDISAIAPVAAAVHVEVMADGIRADEVPCRFVAGARRSAGCDVVAAVIELVCDDTYIA